MTDEDILHEQIVGYLNRALPQDVIFYHPANQGKHKPQYQKKLNRMGRLKGVPDLCFILRGGKAAFMEIKTPKGAMSAEQKWFEHACVELGALHQVVRSLDDVDETLTLWGIFK